MRRPGRRRPRVRPSHSNERARVAAAFAGYSTDGPSDRSRGPFPNMLARSVTLNIAGTAGSLLVGFVTSILLARWLGASDRGLLALMTEIYMVALGLVALGLPMTVTY